MSTPTFAEKDPAVVLAEALAVYEAETGVTLAPADPRRLHLQALLLLLSQIRALVDFAGKQNLLRYVSDLWIDALAELWGVTRLPAAASEVTVRFTWAPAGPFTIDADKRVTDGTNLWATVATTESIAGGATYADVVCRCTVAGTASNDVAIGQIDSLVDPIAGVQSVSNTTASIGGSDAEAIEAMRARLRLEPEQRSVAGPRLSYEALARAASPLVLDAVALGADDADDMAGSAPEPGEVRVVITEVDLILPTVPVRGAVLAALSKETVRPLTDDVGVAVPIAVYYDITATYYIAASREESEAEIQDAVEVAHEAFKDWQSGKIGRDVNPSELIYRIVAAGAKRVVLTDPTFAALKRDEVAILVYDTLTYGGIEDE